MSNVRTVNNRASQVRERQNQRTLSRVQQTGQNISGVKKRPVTPISTRGVVSGLTYPSNAAQRVKRQYHYTLGNTGAEIRFPSLPQVKIGWRLVSFFLFIASAVMVYFLFSAPMFQVRQLETEGLVRLTPADLNAVLDIQDKSIVWMDASAAVSQLQSAFPELKEISVQLVLPNHVQISVVERQPVLIWLMDGKALWIDNEGVLIPERGDSGELLVVSAGAMPPLVKTLEEKGQPAENPLLASTDESTFSIAQIQGYGDQVDPAVVDSVFQLSLHIPAGTNILYNKGHGLGWKSEGGWDVFVGLTLDTIDYKLKAYEAMAKKFEEEGISPQWVSVEHLHAPYYRE